MKKSLIAPISLYIVDDQSFYVDDLKMRYSDSAKYSTTSFSTLHRFIDHLSQQKFLKKTIKISVISLKKAANGESTPELVIGKLLSLFPDLNIIKITDEKEMPKDEFYKRSGNVTFVKRSENTLLRVDNSIKYIIGKRTLEFKEYQRKIANRLFLVSIFLFLILVVIVRVFYPKIFYF